VNRAESERAVKVIEDLFAHFPVSRA